jgi:hypothetical protein
MTQAPARLYGDIDDGQGFFEVELQVASRIDASRRLRHVLPGSIRVGQPGKCSRRQLLITVILALIPATRKPP